MRAFNSVLLKPYLHIHHQLVCIVFSALPPPHDFTEAAKLLPEQPVMFVDYHTAASKALNKAAQNIISQQFAEGETDSYIPDHSRFIKSYFESIYSVKFLSHDLVTSAIQKEAFEFLKKILFYRSLGGGVFCVLSCFCYVLHAT